MGARILVIDDDHDTCQLLTECLQGAGYDVESRPDGRSALAAFLDAHHDVVITDVRMPGMDGLEVLRSLKSIAPDVGVIIFSAVVEGRTRTAIEALRGGASDYLIKPLRDLGDLERSVAAAMEKRASVQERERRVRDLERRARTDPLTGLGNRLELEQRLAEEFSRLGRSLEGLSVALFDVDHFKAINDARGHLMGDRVLAAVALALRENCRAYDVKARFGGDEFVVVMPETRLEQGLAVADKIRRAASALRIADGAGELRVTLSAGVTSTSPFEGLTPDELVRRADLALYEAKRAGRDRTLPWESGQPVPEVLVVEADPGDAQMMTQMCVSLGYRADWARTGAEAIERAASSRYALVLVNIQLPDLEGAEALGRIRVVSPTTSAVLIADADQESARVLDALSRFPVPLERKPVSIDHLRALLSEARLRL